jgi:hypothetical protein
MPSWLIYRTAKTCLACGRFGKRLLASAAAVVARVCIATRRGNKRAAIARQAPPRSRHGRAKGLELPVRHCGCPCAFA